MRPLTGDHMTEWCMHNHDWHLEELYTFAWSHLLLVHGSCGRIITVSNLSMFDLLTFSTVLLDFEDGYFQMYHALKSNIYIYSNVKPQCIRFLWTIGINDFTIQYMQTFRLPDLILYWRPNPTIDPIHPNSDILH